MSYNEGMFRPDVLALLIPIGLMVVLPIVAILTHHQRKMAEIVAQRAAAQSNPEIAALRHEVRELKELIHQQAIMLDGRAPQTDDVRQRMVS